VIEADSYLPEVGQSLPEFGDDRPDHLALQNAS